MSASRRNSAKNPAATSSGPKVMNQRGPWRSASAPKRRESRNITPVGSKPAEPAASALNPATCCRKRVRKKPCTAIPPYIRNVSTFATVKLRCVNSSSGSIGAGVRRS